MDEMMCGRKGQKELELLRCKVDQSTSNVENLQKTEEENGKDMLSSDEVRAKHRVALIWLKKFLALKLI